MCLLELARCFQEVNEPQLGLDHYQLAIEEIPDRDEMNKKKRRSTWPAVMPCTSAAGYGQALLNHLASMDYNFHNVFALLAKVSKLREKGENREGDGGRESEKK